MDLLEIPSISDDELDYEVDADAPDTSSTVKHLKINNKEVNQRQAGFSGRRKDVLYVDASKSRKRRKEKGSKEDSSNSDLEYTSSNEGDVGERRRNQIEEAGAQELVKFSGGRLEGRIKRFGKTITDPEENIRAEQFAQILDAKKRKQRKLSDAELEALYASIDADPDDGNLRLNALLVTGSVEKMNTFDISRIFAEFNPESVRSLGTDIRSTASAAFVVTFESAFHVAQLLYDNTKPLRRIRMPKKPEEGELVDSEEDEEEGQLKEEGGDDVAVVKDVNRMMKRSNSDVVEVDIQTVKVPPGKWRVVTKHVPDNKLLLVRIATGLQLRAAVLASRNAIPHFSSDQFDGGSNYKNAKIRPGLNVFDGEGKELDWDYEHDTRFFEEGDWDDKEAENKKEDEKADKSSETAGVEASVEGMKIRSRGRGAKKFLQALMNEEE